MFSAQVVSAIPMAEHSVFHDLSGRRRRRFAVATIAFAILLLLAGIAFAATILAVTPQTELPFAVEHGKSVSSANGDFFRRTDRTLRRTARRLSKLWSGRATTTNQPLAIGFHVPWDDASVASLQRHVEELDWLVPGWVSITGPDHHVTTFPDRRGQAILAHAVHRPLLLPMIQNALAGEWDGAGMAALLHDATARRATLDRVEALLVANRADGAFFDFEDLPASAQPDYRRFLAEAHARFAQRHWLIAIAIPADDPDWDLAAYGRIADKLFLMAYDEHYQGGPAGPIASQGWFESVVARAQRLVPPDRLVVAVASYGYDWGKSGETQALSVNEAWLSAHDSGVLPVFDPVSGESHFEYDEAGVHHQVWLADAAAVRNEVAALHRMGVRSIALWRMGTEDPSLWNLFGRDNPVLPPAKVVEAIPSGTDVDIEGAGEVLRIGAVAVDGMRRIQTDAAGTITGVRFVRLPTPYQVQRTGFRPGLVALTFDDGPDPTWTPRILDVLKRYSVPATFFVIGENGLTERGLLTRELAEGHEIGSHTYTHPNLGRTSPRETRLELNATQRLFQAFTGHSLRLFRAPYFGDAEPTTADEIVPVAEAQSMGYLSVGLHVDPGDWKRPGVQTIVDQTIAGVMAGPKTCPEDAEANCSRNIVLLHDAGGDRAQTVAALPAIIEGLRQRGFRFVPVSELANLPRQLVNPPIAQSDLLAARADLGLFLMLGWLSIGINWLFMVAITLGIARAVCLSGLALVQARREARTVFPPIDPTTLVTVLIPAFNEERVIERAVRRVLDSRDVNVAVIVIDDGSQDATSQIVRDAFADEPRVTLLTLPNGGKARALNTALEQVRSEVVIALDADTQFEATTIARLARWFVDPELGAVAGNAKVGNRVNLVTRWQALEYITAQNLERRALGRLNAMTVVPGAVGAWRTQMLRQVGGYPIDTLAEDQDLTIAVQRAGWRVAYDQYAIAWTEAPENFRGLAKQRFRWAFGTLQCLWKHRSVIGRGKPRGLALIGLPQAILFQILLAAVSPIIDLALLLSLIKTWGRVAEHGWAQTQTDLGKMLTFWLIFTAIDLLAATIAFALERRERWRLLWLLVPQRVGYRQVMYYVVLKALVQAIRGPSVGWGKLERSGRGRGMEAS
jgi:cellulose synthase/poly-beta-1,6-N-acetylglucosamine synthase-like glycosyltransferase/peptidoglycan/xylan/chitin deacetylase (PgdA/CDA1 family)/spore germination protein YaaH